MRADSHNDGGRWRQNDWLSSRAAGEVQAASLNALHLAVLDALDDFGPMTDEQIERLPQFQALAPSTARKRRSELYHRGKIKALHTAVNSRGRLMQVWGPI
jgi:hypothetical protein